jgi:general L-amino acid transport system substrate-binding protein
MVPVGKLVIALVWMFWVIAVDSTAEGNPADQEIVQIRTQLDDYNPTYGMTLARVKERGVVLCGTKEDFPGFSEMIWTDEHGQRWVGLDVDICRAIAAAVFDDADAIEFIEVDGKTRFSYLIDGTIDVLSAATTYTFTRNVYKKLEFLPTTFYDGQGFMVRKTLGVSSAKQMEGARICFSSTGTAAKNIKDFFKKHFITYIPIEVKPPERPKSVYLRGDCDMYGTDRSGLASNRLQFNDPDWHMILPEIISKEPLGPVVKYGDQQWSDIVRWSVYVLFIAEEMGINSQNIDRFANNIDPNIQRFMGELNGTDHPHLGAKLEISATWAYSIIKQVGNYKEIFERNVGEDSRLKLSRGMNKLYSNGGLLYAPPLK